MQSLHLRYRYNYGFIWHFSFLTDAVCYGDAIWSQGQGDIVKQARLFFFNINVLVLNFFLMGSQLISSFHYLFICSVIKLLNDMRCGNPDSFISVLL